jgi:KDO2-lipid IV(A) lauroyltransferase
MSFAGRPGRHDPPPPHSVRLYRVPAFALGEWLARVAPLALTRFLAGLAGWLYAWTHPGRVEIVQRNLRLLEPALPRGRARRVYAEFGRTMADYFYLGTRPAAEAARIIARAEGNEHLARLRQRGGGAIVVTAHFGLFELGGLMLAQSGVRPVVLTFPEPSEALTGWRAAFRRRWRAGTLEIGADPFAFVGDFVATLIDRPRPGGDVPVRLPGGWSRFSTGILLLAASGGWPVLPAALARRADGTYHSRIFAPVEIRELGSREETLRHYSQLLADTLLPMLREYPEQWYQFVPLAPGA